MPARFFRRTECQLSELIDLLSIKTVSTVAADGIHQRIEDAVDGEDFLLTDAEQVVVVGCPFDDRSGRVFDVGCFVHHDRRITGTGDDGPLVAGQSSPGDSGAAGDNQQTDPAVPEDRLGRFQSRFFDDGHQVLQPGGFVNRLVKSANSLASDSLSGRMRVEHDRIACRQHADDVAGQRGERMRHRSNGSDDAERSIFGDRQTVVTAHRVASERFDTGNQLDDLQLFNLMIQPADLGFFQFQPAEFFGLFGTNSIDTLNGLGAIFH